MTAKVIIECNGFNCTTEAIDNDGTSDDVQQLLAFNEWHNDPTTDEYHYCTSCWPEVQAEYIDMHNKGELCNAG